MANRKSGRNNNAQSDSGVSRNGKNSSGSNAPFGGRVPPNGEVSAENLEKIVRDDYIPYENIDWNGVPLTVRTHIPFNLMLQFVRDVVETCFSVDTGEYLPEAKDIAIKCAIIEYYSNLELPEDIEQKYEFVYRTNAVQVIMEHLDKNQLNQILVAIDDKTAHRARSNIEAVNVRINEVISRVNEIQENIANLFSGIDNATISGIANAISDGAIDEEKLVKAIMEQRAENSAPAVV